MKLLKVLIVAIYFFSPSFAYSQISKLADSVDLYVSMDKYVILARAGEYKEAIDGLEKLYRKHGDNQKLLGEYITILSWDEQYRKAASLIKELNQDTAVDYAVNASALSLRKIGDLKQAESIYKKGVAKYPENANLVSGLILTSVDLKNFIQAVVLFRKYSNLLKDNDANYKELQKYINTNKDLVYAENQQIKAANLAGNGEYEKAIKIIDGIYKKYPDNQSVLYDYIIIANWNSEFEKSAKLAEKVNLDMAPDYALASVAEAFRKSGNFEKAKEIYKKGYEKFPDNFHIASGYAFTVAETESPQKGYSIFNSFTNAHKYIDKADVAEVERYFSSMGVKVKNTETVSKNDGQVKKQAPKNYTQRTDVISSQNADEKWKRDLDTHVKEINKHFNSKSCQKNKSCIIELLKARMYTYSALKDYEKAIQDYEKLLSYKKTIENKYLFKAADAYMGLRQPNDAMIIYEQILKNKKNTRKDMFAAKNGLFWTKLESENLAEAKQIAKDLAKEMKIDIVGCQSNLAAAKPLYDGHFADARYINVFNAQAILYTGNSGCGQEYLENVVKESPDNDNAISVLAEAYVMRGLPHKALETINIAENIYKSAYYEIQKIGYYMASAQWEKADEIIKKWDKEQPYNTGFMRAKKAWDVHNMNKLAVSVGFSSTDSLDPASTPDEGISFDTTLYSKPFNYNWRLYAGYRFATGEFAEGKANQRRYTVGTQYNAEHLEANFELSHENTIDDEYGGAFFGVVRLDDHWRIPFRASINSVNTPLRAIKSDITADDAGLGVQYYWNDYRSVAFNANTFRFSDGNDRVELSASLSQRLLTADTHSLTGYVYLYNSYNSEDDNRPYFNPKKDFSVGLNVQYDGLIWRHYDKSFNHRLNLGVGNYYQQYYGSDINYNATYMHIWNISPRFYTEYGYVFSRPIYDGEPEIDHNFFLNFVWRF